MSNISNNRASGLNWEQVGLAKKPPSESSPIAQDKKTINLPETSFLEDTAALRTEGQEIEVTPSNRSSFEAVRKTTQFLIENRRAISKDGTSLTLIKDELKIFSEQIGKLGGKGLSKSTRWVEIKTANGESLWFFIDAKKGKIGFLEPPSPLPTYFHTYPNENNDVITEGFTPILSLYKNGEKDRLNDTAFFEKIESSQNFRDASQAKALILNYLKAKKEKLPAPKDAPFFYEQVGEFSNFSPRIAEKIIGIELMMRGNFSSSDLKNFLDRAKFLTELDSFMDELKKLSSKMTAEVTEPEPIEDNQSDNSATKQVDKNDLTALAKLDASARLLRVWGYELERSNAIKEDELEALVNSLKLHREIIVSVAADTKIEGDFLESQIEMKPLDIVIEEPETNAEIIPVSDETQVESGKTQVEPSSIEVLSEGPSFDSSLEELAKEAEKIKSRETQLSNCIQLCSSIKTLNEGIKELNHWIKLYQPQADASNEILRGICLALPLPERNALSALTMQEALELDQSFDDIRSYLDQEKQLLYEFSISKSANTLDDEGAKNLYYIASTLTGYLSFALGFKLNNQDVNPYPLHPFIQTLERGMFLKDPAIQMKCASIADAFFTEKKIKGQSLLTNIQNPTQIMPLEDNSPFIENHKKYFDELIIKPCRDLFSKSTELKESTSKAWQNLELAITWGRLIQKIHHKIINDTRDLRNSISAKNASDLEVRDLTTQCNSNLKYAQLVLKDANQIKQDHPDLWNEINLLLESHKDLGPDEFLANLNTVKMKLTTVLKGYKDPYAYSFKGSHEDVENLPKLKDSTSSLSIWLDVLKRTETNLSEATNRNQINIEAHEKLKAHLSTIPLYCDLDFNKLEKNPELAAQLPEDLHRSVFSAFADTASVDELQDKLFIDLKSINEQQSEALIIDTSQKLQNSALLLGFNDNLPKNFTAPNADLLFELFLITASTPDKEQLFHESYPALAFGAKMFTEGYASFINLMQDPVTDHILLEKFAQSNTPISKLIEKQYKKSSSQNNFEILGFKRGTQVGFGLRTNPNAIVNNSSDAISNGSQITIKSIHKELSEIATEGKDAVWKTINFIYNHPLTIRDPIINNAIFAYLFDFQRIDHLIEGERNGVHRVVSREIPKKFNDTIRLMQSKLVDPGLKEEDKQIALHSLGKLLHIAKTFKKYLERQNDLVTEDKDKLNLNAYENYNDIHDSLLTQDDALYLSTTFQMQEFAKESLNSIEIEELRNLTPERKEAILFYLAALHFSDYSHPSETISHSLQLLKNEPNYGNHVLRHNFLGQGKVEIPKGLQFNAANQTLQYKDQTVNLPNSSKDEFLLALFDLNIPAPKGLWYLENPILGEKVQSLLGKPLGFFAITNASNDLYEIKGTPYRFNEQGEVFYEMPDTDLLKMMEGKRNPFVDFGLEHLYNEKSDHLFQDERTQKIWLVRAGKLIYSYDENHLVRLKDGAICPKEENKAIWHIKGENENYMPYSIEFKAPANEYKLVNEGGKTKLESVQHPGFYISTKPPICKGFDLRSIATDFVLLENSDGEQLFICVLKGDEQKQSVEYTLSNDSLRTKNPWDMVHLLLLTEDQKLILSHANELFINAPTNEQETAISELLAKKLESNPDPSNFSTWVEWFILDRIAQGKAGGFGNRNVEEVFEVFGTYMAFKSASKFFPEIKLSKETERLFLQECQTWFDETEKQQIDRIKNLRKSQKNARSESESESEKPSFLKKIMQRFMQGSTGDIEKAKSTLSELRAKYRLIFKPGVHERRVQLQTGKSPIKASRWKTIKVPDPSKLSALGDLMHMLKKSKSKKAADKKGKVAADEEIEISEVKTPFTPTTPDQFIAFQILEKRVIDAPLKSHDPKIALEKLHTWDELKELSHESFSKEGFTLKYLLDFYTLATSLPTRSEERKAMLEWLELTFPEDENCSWIAGVARNHHRYPKIEQLLKNEMKIRETLQKVNRTLNNLDAKLKLALKAQSDKKQELNDINKLVEKTSDEMNSHQYLNNEIDENIRTVERELEDQKHTHDYLKKDLEYFKTTIRNFATSQEPYIVDSRTRYTNKISDAEKKIEELEEKKTTLNIEKTDLLTLYDDLNTKMGKQQTEKNQLVEEINDYNVETVRLEKEMEQLKNGKQIAEETFYASVENALTKKSTWKIVSAIFKLIIPMSKLYFQGRRLKKPLKLSDTAIARPYISFKKSTIKTNESPIQFLDNAFDSYFNNWKQKLLNETPTDRTAERALVNDNKIPKEAKDHIEEYRNLEKTHSYSLKTDADVFELKQALDAEVMDCQKELKVREAALLFQANQSIDRADELKRSFTDKQIEWKDLIKLAYKDQEYAYQKHLRDPSQIKAIQNGVYQYLAIRTRLYQMERIQSTLSSLKQDRAISPLTIQKLGEQLSETRAYDATKAKDLPILFFEAASPKGLFRKEQYDKVNELGSNIREIAEMPTGFGKTDYIIPMINQRAKDIWKEEATAALGKTSRKTLPNKMILKRGVLKTKQFVINLWPSALSRINKEALHRKTELATQGNVQQLTFSRDTHLDSTQLEHLLYRFERAAEKGEAISVRSSDISSIHLHWIEQLEVIHSGHKTPETMKCAELYGKILTLLFTTSTATIDEAHDILDPMQKTIYTLGKFTTVPKEAVEFATDMFDLLLENNAFKSIVDKNESIIPDQLEEKMKEVLSDATIQKIANIVGIKNYNLNEFKAFLKGDIPIKGEWKGDVDKLNLAKGYYTVIIKASLGGAVNVSFGLSKLHYNHYQYAIPYEKKDVPKESADSKTPSSYQNIDETLMKTLRTYHLNGLSKENLIHLCEKLLENYEKERIKAPNLETIRYPSYALLKEIFGKGGIDEKQIVRLSECSLEARSTKLMALCTEETLAFLTKDQVTINLFIKHIVAAQIRIYPNSIGMTAQDLLGTLLRSISVSATPQPEKVHSLRSVFISMTGATGKMFDLLYSKMQGVKQIPANDDNDTLFIQKVAKGCKERNIRTVADPSGLKRFDYPFVEKMADGLKNSDSGLQYIVFYDTSKGQLMRYNILSKISSPFDLKSHRPGTTLTLYDQARSTGTDIFQSPDAAMILLLGDSTTAIQAGQGAGRMRQLDKAQSFEAWTTLKPKKQLSIEEQSTEILEKLITNGLQTSLHKNKAAFDQLMKSELKIALSKKMLQIPIAQAGKKPYKTRSLNVKKMVENYKKFRSEFVDHTPYNPTLAYGSIGPQVKSTVNLKRLLKRLIEKTDKYFGLFDRNTLKKQLNLYEKIWESIPLPEKDYGIDVGASQEVSTQQEVSQELEVEQESETELQTTLDTSQDSHIWTAKNEWPGTAKELMSLDILAETSLNNRVKIRKIDDKIARMINPPMMVKGKLNKKINNRKITKLQSTRENLANKLQANSLESNSPIRFVRAKDAASIHLPEQLGVGSKFFEDNFLLSSNFSEQLMSKPSPLVDSSHTKILNHILLVQNVDEYGKTNYQAVALDAFDAKQLHILFEMHRADKASASKSQVQRKMAIYSLDMNAVIDQGGTKFTDEELNATAVAMLSAQAKLLSGKTNYSESEKAYLKTKIEQINKSVTEKETKSGEKKKTMRIGKSVFSNMLKHFTSPDRQHESGRFKHILDF